MRKITIWNGYVHLQYLIYTLNQFAANNKYFLHFLCVWIRTPAHTYTKDKTYVVKMEHSSWIHSAFEYRLFHIVYSLFYSFHSFLPFFSVCSSFALVFHLTSMHCTWSIWFPSQTSFQIVSSSDCLVFHFFIIFLKRYRNALWDIFNISDLEYAFAKYTYASSRLFNKQNPYALFL